MIPAWNDSKCSNCGSLAHAQTLIYRERSPVPGLEFLCKQCINSVPLPSNAVLIANDCAQPGCVSAAACWVERFSQLEPDKDRERHYLCNEHSWRWRESLGLEWDAICQSLSVDSREIGGPKRLQRDDLAGAFWGDESEEVN